VFLGTAGINTNTVFLGTAGINTNTVFLGTAGIMGIYCSLLHSCSPNPYKP
jgi:hypothetical protein